MADVSEYWDRDVAWLKRNFPLLATESFTHAFCEAVASNIARGKSESVSRFLALTSVQRQIVGTLDAQD